MVEDDIGLASVTLHVLGEDERTFSMEHQEDGGWTTSFLPLEEDVQVWVEASDGAHDVSSEIMDIDVSPAGSDTDRSTTLAMELGVAAFAAVLLTAIIAIIAFRRKT